MNDRYRDGHAPPPTFIPRERAPLGTLRFQSEVDARKRIEQLEGALRRIRSESHWTTVHDIIDTALGR